MIVFYPFGVHFGVRLQRHGKTAGGRLREISGVRIEYPVESNGVFVRIPKLVESQLHARGWHFYTDVITGEESRLMCSWDTMAEDMDDYLADWRALIT